MKNGEFLINTKEGVVVFAQRSHGKEFASVSQSHSDDKFNIGIGQLVAMKRNEIKIRKADIKAMRMVAKFLGNCMEEAEGTTAGKCFAQYKGITDEKINASLNHIRELKSDLETLYTGTYLVQPYAEIRAARLKGTEPGQKRDYVVPQEVVDGTHIYKTVGGSTQLVKLEDEFPTGMPELCHV